MCWQRWISAFVGVLLVGSAACGGGGGRQLATEADDLVRAIARSQDVDESAVRSALRSAARNDAEELALARQWKAELPASGVPSLTALMERIDTGTAEARRALLAAGCGAVIEYVRTGQAPDIRTFLASYLQGQLLGQIPTYQVQQMIDEFEALFNEAAAGQWDYVDTRLTLMRYQYCR